jgi:hypothetical protein
MRAIVDVEQLIEFIVHDATDEADLAASPPTRRRTSAIPRCRGHCLAQPRRAWQLRQHEALERALA